jgi:V8-like Glu-specific endopeptidase
VDECSEWMSAASGWVQRVDDKYIIKNNKIVKIGSIIKEVIRIDYYKRFSSLITSYKVKIVVYYFYNIKILTKYTNLDTITIIDEELYNFTAIPCVTEGWPYFG